MVSQTLPRFHDIIRKEFRNDGSKSQCRMRYETVKLVNLHINYNIPANEANKESESVVVLLLLLYSNMNE